MKEQRSASQILFGLLPEQTVDIRSGVWKVAKWNTTPVNDVDEEALRGELLRVAAPWEAGAGDGNYVRDLRAGRRVRVASLDRDKGVVVAAFPKTWRCRTCGRLHDAPGATCACGRTGPHGQLPFVLFHDACGKLAEPYYPKCPRHRERALDLPSSTRLEEMRLHCPRCSWSSGPQFRIVKCDCGRSGRRGENMEYAVHRSATVYTPRSVVIVNPPNRAERERLEHAGGADTALRWVLGGLRERWVDDLPGTSAAGVRARLVASGLDAGTIERMMAQMGGDDDPWDDIALPASVGERARREAVAIALAMSKKGSRVMVDDLVRDGPTSERRLDVEYPDRMADAGLQGVDLIDRFPVLKGMFGYTRGDHEPGASCLKPFYEKDGTYVVYGDRAETEALLLRLRPSRVLDWLRTRGVDVDAPTGGDEAAIHRAILSSVRGEVDDDEVFGHLETLIHSLSHRTIRQASLYAGIDRNSLSELLFPTALSFVVYAEPRGGFVLGGLQALFEGDLHLLLDRLVNDDPRCALDPGCGQADEAACAVCLHLGEPSCRLFNTRLDRRTMFGSEGFLGP